MCVSSGSASILVGKYHTENDVTHDPKCDVIRYKRWSD